MWGGAVASFSSGGAGTSSSSSTAFRTSGSSGYSPDDLTPSLTTTAGGATTVTSMSADPDADGSDSAAAAPTKFLGCVFGENYAFEDGGAICEWGPGGFFKGGVLYSAAVGVVVVVVTGMAASHYHDPYRSPRPPPPRLSFPAQLSTRFICCFPPPVVRFSPPFRLFLSRFCGRF